jgi:hypothetical protein
MPDAEAEFRRRPKVVLVPLAGRSVSVYGTALALDIPLAFSFRFFLCHLVLESPTMSSTKEKLQQLRDKRKKVRLDFSFFPQVAFVLLLSSWPTKQNGAQFTMAAKTLLISSY